MCRMLTQSWRHVVKHLTLLLLLLLCMTDVDLVSLVCHGIWQSWHQGDPQQQGLHQCGPAHTWLPVHSDKHLVLNSRIMGYLCTASQEDASKALGATTASSQLVDCITYTSSAPRWLQSGAEPQVSPGWSM